MAFEKQVPEWLAAGIEPPESLKKSGFTAGYKPPADYFNWFWHTVSEALRELQAMTPEGIGAVPASRTVNGKQLGNDVSLTAGDVGAAESSHTHDYLPLSGGVMTGQGFYLNNKTGRIVNNANGLWLRTASSDVDNNADSRHLKLWNSTYQTDLAKALALFDTTTGKDYLLYGQHNKPTPADVGALPLSGGELSGELIVNENFQVRKTFEDVPYRSYVKPINYALGGDYCTGLIHYVNGANDSQFFFNRNGVALRDNANSKLYQIYGQHNVTAMRSESLNRTTKVNAHDTNYTTLIARGTSLNSVETNPTANGAIAWTYE